VEFFCGGGGEVVDVVVGAFGVVPVHPFQRGGFDLVQALPRPFCPDGSVLCSPMVVSARALSRVVKCS
jgi:hypothetical protein